MVAAFLLAFVSVLASTLLGILVLHSLRRVRPIEDLHTDLSKMAGEVSTLRKDQRAVEELLDTFRKRDANRSSQASQRKTREEAVAQPVFDADLFRTTGQVQ